MATDREGRELWGLALTAVFALGIAEMWMARIGSVQKSHSPRENVFSRGSPLSAVEQVT